MAEPEEFNALKILNKIKTENDGTISITRAYNGSIVVNLYEGIEEGMITGRKRNNASKELINTDTITYKNVSIVKIINNLYSLSWDKYITAEFSIEEGRSYIRLINFFMNGVDKVELTDLYEVESGKVYVPSLLGMNLLYFFINKLRLEEKKVSDFHISMRKVEYKTKPYRNADNDFYSEFGFEKIEEVEEVEGIRKKKRKAIRNTKRKSISKANEAKKKEKKKSKKSKTKKIKRK